MKTKHTPAPWFAIDYAGSHCLQTKKYYAEGCNLLYSDDMGEDVAQANAQLASLSPQLLEGCQMFADYLKTHGKQNSILYKTISKTIKNATK